MLSRDSAPCFRMLMSLVNSRASNCEHKLHTKELERGSRHYKRISNNNRMGMTNYQGAEDLFDFDSLKLVDKPDSPKNAKSLPQTLEGCEGYIKKLPLKAPNADQKDPRTIQDMVNILTDRKAAALFDKAEAELANGGEAGVVRPEGHPSSVYDYKSSAVMMAGLHSTRRQLSHMAAPWVFGHVVMPGCISFYQKDGKTYAATEGRWTLPNPKARWVANNISLDQDQIQPENTKVLIIRVPPGSVGRVRDQGVEILLDVGTHVFNSGTVVNAGTCEYCAQTHIPHGRYNL